MHSQQHASGTHTWQWIQGSKSLLSSLLCPQSWCGGWRSLKWAHMSWLELFLGQILLYIKELAWSCVGDKGVFSLIRSLFQFLSPLKKLIDFIFW